MNGRGRWFARVSPFRSAFFLPTADPYRFRLVQLRMEQAPHSKKPTQRSPVSAITTFQASTDSTLTTVPQLPA
jgi:hypothetical protein